MKFRCAVCHHNVPVERLAHSSLDEAGVSDPRRAVRLLRADQLLCQSCEESDTPTPTWGLEWSDAYYRYEGLDVSSRARRDVTYLNY